MKILKTIVLLPIKAEHITEDNFNKELNLALDEILVSGDIIPEV